MRWPLITGFFIACSGSPKSAPVVPNPPDQPASAGPGEPARPSPAASPSTAPDRPGPDAAKRDTELAVAVTGYIDAFPNTDPVFTRDGKQIVFLSTRDGLPQIYVTKKSDGTVTRVAETKQRIGEVIAAPGG